MKRTTVRRIHSPRYHVAGNLMSGSAVALLVFGLAALFFPELAADALGHGATVPVQLFGGALLGFAFLNWMGRSAILGGIYGRPIVVGNFGLGVITAGTSISASFDGRLPQWGWALAAIFMIHALGFFRLMRRPPGIPALGLSLTVAPGDRELLLTRAG